MVKVRLCAYGDVVTLKLIIFYTWRQPFWFSFEDERTKEEEESYCAKAAEELQLGEESG